jgi:uncharacterized protein (DUF1330 family)
MFEVVHLLTGDPAPPPLLDSMVDLYIAKRKMDLESAMWYGHYFSPEAAQSLIAAYKSLPDASRFSYLLSPATYEAVHGFENAPHENCDLLISYAYDQLSVAQGVPPDGYKSDAQVIWSPTGGEMLLRNGEGWTLQYAAKLDSLVVIDFDSPLARGVRDSPLMSRPAEDFSQTEREIIIMKLERAFRHVDGVAPTFGRLIRNYTRAARIRKCRAFTDVSSEHVTNTIGEIRLMNVQDDVYSIEKLSEALVHESVHNLLSTYEYLNGPFLLSVDNRDYRPVSTWSGNLIPVGSFCHAVFVWFALFNFALRELQQPDLSPKEKIQIQQRRNRYASGFLVPTPLSKYLQDLALFSKDYLPTIDGMQETVLSLVRNEASQGMEEETAVAA